LSDAEWPANIRARMHFYAAAISYSDGDLSGAMTSCLDCLRLVRDLSFTHTRTFASYLTGASRYWRNELEEAEADLLDVLDDLPAANPSYSANAAFVLACVELARGRVDRAEQVVARVTAHLRDNDFGTALTIARAFRVEIALRRHDLAAARRLSRAVDFDLRPPLWFFYAPQLTPVKLQLAEGTDESLSRARERLVEMDERLLTIHRTSVRLDVLALLALVCRAQGEETEALEHLETALELAEAGPWVRNFVDLGAPMTALLQRLVADRPEHRFASHVLSACGTGEIGRTSIGRRRATSNGSARQVTSGSVLTRREIEIVALLDDGLSNQEIAERLFISIHTVKTHLQNIYGKLDAKGRARALTKVRQLGLTLDR
jgi:LuxR family maltose regulon positive regulatory protein